jgi:multicomponent Na+:H+ antiporter subunit D
MSTEYPALVILVPLLSAFVCSALMWGERRCSYPLAVAALGVSCLFSLLLLLQVMQSGPAEYHMAGWTPPWGIGYRVDLLNGLVLVVVTAVAFLNLIASRRSIEEEVPGKQGVFCALYLLFVTGLMGVTITGDLFNLYVLLEVTSLTSYALIAMGSPNRAPLASLHYVFLGVMGASFYLLGIGYLYIMTGSLNMVDVANLLDPLYTSQAVMVGFVFCMVGVWIKMAFFPMHVWLPNAYTYAPIGVSRVIAPLMTKVMVYVMIRLMITVFRPVYVFEHLDLSQAVIWLSNIAIIGGGLLALAQRDFKRMLTYLIVSEIGYMVGGAWLGNQAGMTGSILHVFNDALMTFCLFLAMGNLAYKLRDLDMDNLQGLFARMPVTMTCLVAGGLSVVGIPPTCGFFSKWYLISGAVQAGQYSFLVALLLSSFINAFLFFRIIEKAYFEPMTEAHAHGGHGHGHGVAVQEAPLSMLIPLGAVGTGLIVAGLYSGVIVRNIIVPFLPASML